MIRAIIAGIWVAFFQKCQAMIVWTGEAANYMHILARGETHLPFAQPAFGTPCAATAHAAAKAQRAPASAKL